MRYLFRNINNTFKIFKFLKTIYLFNVQSIRSSLLVTQSQLKRSSLPLLSHPDNHGNLAWQSEMSINISYGNRWGEKEILSNFLIHTCLCNSNNDTCFLPFLIFSHCFSSCITFILPPRKCHLKCPHWWRSCAF